MAFISRTQLPSELEALLLTRGVGVPLLDWSNRPISHAREVLQSRDVGDLVTPHRVQDESMAAAVVGLFYLWNGWMDDCLMHVSMAPFKERQYITALCYRHQRKMEESKQAFRDMSGHELFEKLVPIAIKWTAACDQAKVKRIADMAEMIGEWEPYVFIDVLQQLHEERIDRSYEELIRQIQHEEFDLLLTHCYQVAMGVDLTEVVEEEKVNLAATRRLSMSNKASRQKSRPSPASSGGAGRSTTSEQKTEATSVAPAPPKSTIHIICPRCRHQNNGVPIDKRGQSVRCAKCKGPFKVPLENSKPVAETKA